MKIIITENQLKRLILESNSPCPENKKEDPLITINDLKNGKTIKKGYCNGNENSAVVYIQSRLKELGKLDWSGKLGYFGDKTVYTLCGFLGYTSCPDTMEYGKKTIKALEDGKKLIKKLELDTNNTINEKKLKDFSKNGKASMDIKDFIKSFEDLKLNAYDIKDGKYTIGYGHTEGVEMGDKITKAKAEEFFEGDIQTAEKVVKDILSLWKERGHTYKLTQAMFDALVSLSYNSGRGNMFKATEEGSKFLYYLKKGDYKTAGENIKTYKLRRGFSGLKDRRENESIWFCKEGC